MKSEDINNLIESVQALTLRVDQLARAFESQKAKEVQDEWEVIEESSLPCGASEKDLVEASHRGNLEDGPPATPGFCLDLAQRNLRGVDDQWLGPTGHSRLASGRRWLWRLALPTGGLILLVLPLGIGWYFVQRRGRPQ